MNFYKAVISGLILSICIVASGQTGTIEKGLASITQDALKAQLGFLASDWMEGREAGEKGEFMAADYIASLLGMYGIKPFGDYSYSTGTGNAPGTPVRTFFQNFTLLKTLPGDEQILKIRSSEGETTITTDLAWNVDFIFNPTEPGLEIEAPVVFAGYGYINDSLKFNDFSNLDVRGKFILKIAGLPEFVKRASGREKTELVNRSMEARYRSMGIAGILEFDPLAGLAGSPAQADFLNMSPAEGKAVSGKPRARYSIPGKKAPDNLVKITVSSRAAYEILKGTGTDPEEYQRKADRNVKAGITGFNGKTIYFRSCVKTTRVTVRNILGIVEGRNPDSYLVLGAHYDHLGSGNGYIWNGADDNGSGTVGVMSIARAVMATGEKPESGIIFALWTAEEEGLLGSRYFVRNLGIPREHIKLNMNFDMISRYISDNEPSGVTMTYTASCPEFREMTAANLQKYGIGLLVDYQPSADPPGGSDHRSFVEAGIPVLRFKPGHREEYHTPRDETATVDWDIMEKIVRIGFADTWELANMKW